MTLPNQSMKSWRSVNHLALSILAISSYFSPERGGEALSARSPASG